MKIKSLLLGSAAALVAVSGARAADAVIIPEPEVVEYVRVCDAAGTGFFYIPGTETCLKIGGYARFQINHHAGDDETDYAEFFSRAALKVSSYTDSEYGPVETYFEYHMDSNDDAYVDSVYFTIAGLKMGYFGGFLDNGINGETDGNGLNNKFDAIQYTGTAGAISFGMSIDEIDNDEGVWNEYDDMKFGVEGMIGFSAGAIDATLVGFYDLYYEAGGVVARVSADVGMGTLQGRASWYQEDLDGSAYLASSGYLDGDSIKYVLEASYAAPVGDKLTLTPGVSYKKGWGDDTMWVYGLTADYNLTETLAIKASVQYTDFDDDYGTFDDYTSWSNFLRLTASF